jgi:mono/diheme cytochrome c family protein
MMRQRSVVPGILLLTAAGAFALAQGTTQGTSQGARGGAQAGQARATPGAAGTAGGAGDVPLDNWQPRTLPALPAGVTLVMIRQGDSVFHGKGGCVTCHGADAMGMPNSGSALSLGLNFIPDEPKAIDSLVTAGIPEALTRASIAMPPRGAAQNLTPDEIRQVAAYVWAISHVRDEPWPGGHRTHGQADSTGNAHGQVAP